MKPTMQNQMIVAVPADDLTEEQLTAIQDAKITLGNVVSGTKYYFNRIPMLILTPMNRGNMTAWMTQHGLDWRVLITEHEPQAQATLLKYFNKVKVYDDEGVLLDELSITNLDGILHTFAGHKWDMI